jgi:hypothetical protein
MRQHPVDLVGIAVVTVASVASVLVAGRLRTEPLVRRADLVAQLHFAVTMQDLRTVMLLRRQLRGERPRAEPWVQVSRQRRHGTATAIWWRGWRGLLRYPLARLTRMAGLAVAAALSAVAVLHGTTPAVIGVGVGLYLLGLDAVEPLAQEIDHPDHTDGFPHPRGWVLVHQVAAPGIALVPFALLGAAVVAALRPEDWAGALALAVPVTLAGAGGGVVSIVRDAPDPLAATPSVAVPPEFAGFTNTMRLLWPIALSTLAALPVVAMRELPSVGTAVRSIVGTTLVVVGVVWWIRRRDDWKAKWREFLDAGRQTAGVSR